MKREERVQKILTIAKEKKLNISTLVFLLAMTPDKGLSKIQKQVEDYERLYRIDVRRTPRGKIIHSTHAKESDIDKITQKWKGCVVKIVNVKNED